MEKEEKGEFSFCSDFSLGVRELLEQHTVANQVRLSKILLAFQALDKFSLEVVDLVFDKTYPRRIAVCLCPRNVDKLVVRTRHMVVA